MAFEKLKINSISQVNKRSGEIICDDVSYEMSIRGKNEWVGIRIRSDFKKDIIYQIRFNGETQVEGMALTASAFQSNDWIKEKVFTLTAGKKVYKFLFTPFDSNEIMFIITSYGKYPPGKIKVSDMVVSELFPIKNNNDLREKVEIMQPWYHNFDFNGVETRGKKRNTYREAKWKWITELIPRDMTRKSVLDIACNNGWYSINLAKLGASVTGFDISYDYILRGIFAKSVLNVSNVDFRVATVNDLEKFGKRYDIIFCLGYFYHDMNPLQTLRKILKKGDTVIIDNVASRLDYKDGYVKDVSISRDGLVVSNELIEKTINEEGYKAEKMIKVDQNRFVFKIKC